MDNLTITVLGSGCAKCKTLYETTKAVAAELGVETEVGYSTDIEKMIELGAMSSPVIAVNGKLVLEGSAPKKEDLKQLLMQHANKDKKEAGDCCCGSC